MADMEHTQEMHIFKVDDPNCGKTFMLAVTEKEFDNWEDGMLIQDAMPSLTLEERELLISGTCPQCWEAMMPKEDEM